MAHIVDDIHNELKNASTRLFTAEDRADQLALICKLLSVFRALKLREIQTYLRHFQVEVSVEELKRKLFLLTSFELVKKVLYSSNTYYVRDRSGGRKVAFRYLEGQTQDELRVTLECNKFYAEQDSHRKLAISLAHGGGDE